MSPGSVRVRRGQMMVVINVSPIGAVVVPIVRSPRWHYAGDVAVEIVGWHDLVARCHLADLLTDGSDDMGLRLTDAALAQCQSAARRVVEMRQYVAKYSKPADPRSVAYIASASQRWVGHRVGTHRAA